MIFYTLLTRYIGQEINLELKNGLEIKCILKSVDVFLNLKVEICSMKGIENFLEISNASTFFIRGSSIKFYYFDDKNEEMEQKLLDSARYRFCINEDIEN